MSCQIQNVTLKRKGRVYTTIPNWINLIRRAVRSKIIMTERCSGSKIRPTASLSASLQQASDIGRPPRPQAPAMQKIEKRLNYDQRKSLSSFVWLEMSEMKNEK